MLIFRAWATCGGAGPVTQSHWTAAVERTLISASLTEETSFSTFVSVLSLI